MENLENIKSIKQFQRVDLSHVKVEIGRAIKIRNQYNRNQFILPIMCEKKRNTRLSRYVY